MRGRYYLKHTINHLVSNGSNNKGGNKSSLIENVDHYVNYFKRNPNISITDKINILRNNLGKAETDVLLIKLKDEELCKAYCGKTVEEVKTKYNEESTGCLFILVAFVIIIICIIKAF